MGKKDRIRKVDRKEQKKKGWKVSSMIPGFIIPKDEPIVPRAFTPIDYAVGIAIFFICLAVYLHTLTPTIGFHDSGDMVTAAYVLGIPHPTGYPLYCLLGKLWMTILPIGNIAYRMNLASALCASLTCMMVFFIILKAGSGKREMRSEENKHGYHLLYLVPAGVGALMLAFATTFWEQAVIAEKYTLNALFTTMLIFILLKWQEAMVSCEKPKSENNPQPATRSPQFYLYLFAFTLGLSFTHHMQTIFLLIGGCLFVILTCLPSGERKMSLADRKDPLWQSKGWKIFSFESCLNITPNFLIRLICCFVIPLLLYAYLPVRGNCHPLLNWGCPNTWNRFISHITANEYQTLFKADNLVNNGKNVFELLISEFGYFLWIALTGAIAILFKNRRTLLLFGVIFILNIILVLQYNIYNPEDYCLIAFIMISLLIGQGIEGLMVLVGKLKSSIRFDFLMGMFLLIFGIYLLIIHYPINDRSRYYFAYDYAKDSLNILAKNAIFFSEYKYNPLYFPYWYLLYVEGVRPDTTLMNLSLLLSQEWYQEEMKLKYPFFQIPESFEKEDAITKFDKLVENNINLHPLYLSCSNAISSSITKNQLLFPDGAFRMVLLTNDKETILQKLKDEALSGFYIRQIPEKVLYSEKTKVKEMILNTAQVYSNSGAFYYQKGVYDRAEYMVTMALKIDPDNPDYYISRAEVYVGKQMYAKAINDCQRAISIDSRNPLAYNQLGAVYLHTGMLEKATLQFQKAIELEPTCIPPYLNIAAISEQKGNIKKCLEMCICILKIDPNNTHAQQIMDRNSRPQK